MKAEFSVWQIAKLLKDHLLTSVVEDIISGLQQSSNSIEDRCEKLVVMKLAEELSRND